MSKVRIEVTQEDIGNGKPRNPDKCPVALALRRRFKGYQVVKVSKDEVYFARRPDGPGRWYRLPEKAVVFLSRYYWEGKDAVEPFTFDFERPVM